MLTDKEIFARGWNNLYGVVSGTNMRIQDGQCVLTGSLIGKALWDTFYYCRMFRGQLFGKSPADYVAAAGFRLTPSAEFGEPMMIVQTEKEIAAQLLDGVVGSWLWTEPGPAVCDDAVCLPMSLATSWREWLEANRLGIADVLSGEFTAEEKLRAICPFWTGRGTDFPGIGTFCVNGNGLCCRRPGGEINNVYNVDHVLALFSDLEVAR